MSASLVGSEMCIRDRRSQPDGHPRPSSAACWPPCLGTSGGARGRRGPVSYTHLTLPTICSV
eukprot:2612875-Alexandrium_andersonii.AAC.1